MTDFYEQDLRGVEWPTASSAASWSKGSTSHLWSRRSPGCGHGYPDSSQTFTVAECLHVVLDEEWEHRLCAERDPHRTGEGELT